MVYMMEGKKKLVIMFTLKLQSKTWKTVMSHTIKIYNDIFVASQQLECILNVNIVIVLELA